MKETEVPGGDAAGDVDTAGDADAAGGDGAAQPQSEADRLAAIDAWVAEFWADTTPVDDDYDWDTDGGAVAHAYDPPNVLRPVPPPEPPLHLPPSPEERCERTVVLGQDSPGEFLRACRARAGFSQRDLARESGVSLSVIARIEAGRVDDVRMSTLVRLARVCEVMIVGAVDRYAPLLTSDRAQRHFDNGGRYLPAHLTNWPLGGPDEQPWWGEFKYSLHRTRARPRRTYSPQNFVFQRPDD